MKNRTDILLVDDSTDSLKMLSEILTREGYKCRPVEDPQLALEAALALPPTLILLDVRMPKLSGFELCHLLKQDERTREIPIIFVSALEDTEDKVKGFEAGGVDFVSKPYQEAEILARVNTHLQLRHAQLHLEELVAQRTVEVVESEAKYRGLVDNAVVGVFSSTVDGQLIFANEALAAMYEFDSPERMMAKGVLERWLDLKERNQIIDELQRHGSISNFEAVTVTQTGKILHTLLSVKMIGDTTYGMVVDITKRKMAEAEHEKLFHVSFDLLCIAGMDGYFKELNPSWENATGYTLAELYSKPFLEFIHSDDRERTIKEIEALSQGNPAVDFENRYLKKNGEVLHLSWTAIPEPEGNLMYCSARDVTARKLAEDQAMEYQHKLKALAHELTISEEKVRKQIAADLHDHVGQLLSSTRMQLSGIIEKVGNEDIKDKINNISLSLREASRATREAIHDLSTPQLNEIGLSAAVKDWLKPEADRHGLKVEFISDIDHIRLNEETRILLFRSIKELMTNVLKHAEASQIIVTLKMNNGSLEILVEDDGVGFIYNPDLVQSQSKTFGLFSIRERVSNLNGALVVDSAPDKGTRIKIELPIQEQ